MALVAVAARCLRGRPFLKRARASSRAATKPRIGAHGGFNQGLVRFRASQREETAAEKRKCGARPLQTAFRKKRDEREEAPLALRISHTRAPRRLCALSRLFTHAFRINNASERALNRRVGGRWLVGALDPASVHDNFVCIYTDTARPLSQDEAHKRARVHGNCSRFGAFVFRFSLFVLVPLLCPN